MKRTLPLLLTSILFSSSLLAETKLPVVLHYKKAADQKLWKDKSNIIPAQLMDYVTLETPNMAFKAPFKDNFFHNDQFIVCYKDCTDKQPQLEVKQGENFIVYLPPTTTKGEELTDLKVSNVYYWVTKIYERVKEIDPTLKPRKLTVRVDFDVPSERSGINMRNNAFYNPADHSLNFLTAKRSFFVNFNDSALDPSVIIHEAAHAIFGDLFGVGVNSDISGFNEGFADYVAQSILGDSVIGLVFGKGKALRDSEKIRLYQRNLEVHDMGEAFGFTLNNVRKLFKVPLEADRVLFNFIKALGKNQLATVDGLADLYLKTFDNAEITTEDKFELREEIDNYFALTGLINYAPKVSGYPIIGHSKERAPERFTLTQTLPAELAKKYGTETSSVTKFGIVGFIPIENYVWIKIDIESKKLNGLFWILLSGDISAYLSPLDHLKAANIVALIDDKSGKFLQSNDEVGIDVIEALTASLPKSFSWILDFHEMINLVYANESSLYRAKKLDARLTSVEINGKETKGLSITVKTKAKWYLKILGKSLSKEMASATEVSLIGVSKKELGIETTTLPFPSSPELNDLIFVGLEITHHSGIKEKIIFDTFSSTTITN